LSPYGIKVLAFVFMVVIIGGLGSIRGTLSKPRPGCATLDQWQAAV
jgi:hypothetical protein